MNILHVTPHLGGGVGSVLLNWLSAVKNHSVLCLDYANDRAKARCQELGVRLLDRMDGKGYTQALEIEKADVVVVHYWDHAMLPKFMLSVPVLRDFTGRPKFVGWCHKNYAVDAREIEVLDLFVATSPIVFDQPSLRGYSRYDNMRYIWSSSGPERFAGIQRTEHKGFVAGYVGTVDYKKMYAGFPDMMKPCGLDVVVRIVGGVAEHIPITDPRQEYLGHVEGVSEVLAGLDVFTYPLRPDHYGTCEQALGEAMAAGLPVVCFDNPCERSIVRHGVDGLLAKDDEEFVRHVEGLHGDEWLQQAMGRSARLRALELYSTEKMVRAWEAIFEEVCHG